jgi:hypothetical protein
VIGDWWRRALVLGADGNLWRARITRDREKDLLQGGPKSVDCCGSLGTGNDVENVFRPQRLNVRFPRGVASH